MQVVTLLLLMSEAKHCLGVWACSFLTRFEAYSGGKRLQMRPNVEFSATYPLTERRLFFGLSPTGF